MIHVRLDSKEINRRLNNAVSFSYGFLDGIDMEQIYFNQVLAEHTVDILNKYIDSEARMNPKSLHHVYEWGQTGDSMSRLFFIKAKASKRVIHLYGNFLPSKSISPTSKEPFKDKANVMENSIDIVIKPKNSDFLVFEVEDETVFTRNAIHIDNPGGDEVAGSFGKVVDDFFLTYFTNSMFTPLIEKLTNPLEFSKNFPAGVKSGGRSLGTASGRKYFRSAGVLVE